MIPGKFEYYRPASLNEAVALLSKLGEDARPLAGGHSLIPLMKTRLATPEHLIDLSGISSLKAIEHEGDALKIGAMTSQYELIHSELIARHSPMWLMVILAMTCQLLCNVLMLFMMLSVQVARAAFQRVVFIMALTIRLSNQVRLLHLFAYRSPLSAMVMLMRN